MEYKVKDIINFNYKRSTPWSGDVNVLIEDISYIGVRIPFYAFIREGEKELARHVLDKVGCSDFVI